ncbi:acyltransferase [Rhodanobacter geophilus]|uniref:Acyltransferase n=1 Tax=Rhodanobacter geophilus TaxID=3162488 RepID=A0ABV3QPI5_9GAMM
MIEIFVRVHYVLVSASRFVFYKLMYRSAFRGPLLGLGPRVSVRLRRGGTLVFGRVKTRGCGQIFCDGGHVWIGSGVFLNQGVSINSRSRISIGADVLMGEGVKIYDHDHVISSDFLVDHSQFVERDVEIGQGCWLGSNVVVLKGTQLADRSIIGSGTTVSVSTREAGVYVPQGGGLRKVR